MSETMDKDAPEAYDRMPFAAPNAYAAPLMFAQPNAHAAPLMFTQPKFLLTDDERAALVALRRPLPKGLIEDKGDVQFCGWEIKWAILTHWFPQAQCEVLSIEQVEMTKKPTQSGKDGTKIRAFVRVRIPLTYGTVSQEAYGHEWGKDNQDNDDGIKAAISDGRAICCALFGVGLHLYAGQSRWRALHAYLHDGELPEESVDTPRRQAAPSPQSLSGEADGETVCRTRLKEKYAPMFAGAGVDKPTLWAYLVDVYGKGEKDAINWFELRRTLNQWDNPVEFQHSIVAVKAWAKKRNLATDAPIAPETPTPLARVGFNLQGIRLVGNLTDERAIRAKQGELLKQLRSSEWKDEAERRLRAVAGVTLAQYVGAAAEKSETIEQVGAYNFATACLLADDETWEANRAAEYGKNVTVQETVKWYAESVPGADGDAAQLF